MPVIKWQKICQYFGWIWPRGCTNLAAYREARHFSVKMCLFKNTNYKIEIFGTIKSWFTLLEKPFLLYICWKPSMLCHHSEHFYNHTKADLIEKRTKNANLEFLNNVTNKSNISCRKKRQRCLPINNHPVKTIEALRERNEDKETYRM